MGWRERKEETNPSKNKETQSEDKQSSIFCYFAEDGLSVLHWTQKESWGTEHLSW